MAVLKNAINALDPSHDKKKEITLALSLLSELCEAKVTAFETAIETELRTAGSVENKTIPVTEILARHTEYRAYIKQDAGKIATEVSSAIKKFIAGSASSIIDGIADLVTTGIEAIIGAGSGTQQEMTSYYIVVQSFGILRFDVRAWCRQIEAEGITSQIETALAIVAFKSSVDVTNISLNTFLIAYQNQLGNMGISEGEWAKYLDTAEKLYSKLRGEATSSSSAAALPGAGFATNPIKFCAPGQLYGSLWNEAS